MKKDPKDLRLDSLTLDDCLVVLPWRNAALETLRTSRPLTEHEQTDFFLNVVCKDQAVHRYWAIRHKNKFVGMGGLTYISWENGTAEISLIIDPKQRGKGFGEQAVRLLLREAQAELRLENVYGECHECNVSGATWWEHVVARSCGYWTGRLPRRKFHAGVFWDSFYFGWHLNTEGVREWVNG